LTIFLNLELLNDSVYSGYTRIVFTGTVDGCAGVYRGGIGPGKLPRGVSHVPVTFRMYPSLTPNLPGAARRA
jgi:hypothetical protein